MPGQLFSVNNETAENITDLFARNERCVCVFDTEFGKACVVLVGAMIVAGIETVATGKIKRSDRVQRQTHHMTLKKAMNLGGFIWAQRRLWYYQNQRAWLGAQVFIIQCR